MTQGYSIEDILERAKLSIEEVDYTTADLYCQKALSLDPTNLESLELSSIVDLELGNFDAARKVI